MASYPKIWTTIESASWWQALDLNARGVVTQMIIWCKKDGDTGHLEFRSWRFLAERLGCHRDTCTKIASNLATLGFIEITERPNGTLHIYVTKYLESQQATSHFDVMEMVRDAADLDQNCSKNSQQQNRTEPNQTEQNRTEEETPPFAVVDNSEIEEDWSALASFNRWIAEQENQDAVWTLCKLFGEGLVKTQIQLVRAWVFANDTKAFIGWEKNSIGGGWQNGVLPWLQAWIRRAWQDQQGKAVPAPITAEQEAAHYASKQRVGGDGGFSSVGDLVNNYKPEGGE